MPSSRSEYSVVPAVDADFPTLFAILSDSFARRHPFIESFYPDHQSPAGRVAGFKRLLSFAKGDPETTFVKCIDSEGTILGFSKWNIWINSQYQFPTEQLPWSAGVWDPKPWEGLNGDSSELARWTSERYVHLRLAAKTATKGNLVSLDLMCVSPRYQRLGVGQLLMQWGVEQADKHGVEAVVEASDEGLGLYERFGFKALRHIELRETTGRWNGREAQLFYWMVRPVRGQGNISAEVLAASEDTKDGTVIDSGKAI